MHTETTPYLCRLIAHSLSRVLTSSFSSNCLQLARTYLILGLRSFIPAAGAIASNSLPDTLRQPTRPFHSLRRDLKTLFFLSLLSYTAHSRFRDYAVYKFMIDTDIDILILLTYLLTRESHLYLGVHAVLLTSI